MHKDPKKTYEVSRRKSRESCKSS